MLNAVDAAERGAVIRTRTRCARAERGDTWRLILNARGVREVVTARVLVNAACAWVDTVAEMVLRQKPSGRVRLDKGSHIVVPRLYDHDRAYILQAPDGRVVFAIPFQRDFTLIGTTDQSFEAVCLYFCGKIVRESDENGPARFPVPLTATKFPEPCRARKLRRATVRTSARSPDDHRQIYDVLTWAAEQETSPPQALP